MMTLAMAVFTLAGFQSPRFNTDTTVAVPQGSRLRLQNQGGEVTIKTWDRNQIRIQADHSSRSFVEVDVRGQVVEIESKGRRGLSSVVDYQLTVPTWMALDIGGMYADVSIDGIKAAVKVETLEGNITLRGGAETVTLSTVNGRIDVSGARGRVELHAVSEGIKVADVAGGELVVESVSGDLDMRRIDARSVEAQTISGEVVYEGRIADAGSYSFLSHSGDVTLAVAEATNAAISVVSANGDVSSSFALKAERSSRRRNTYRMGSGGATVEIETFSGDVDIIRSSELKPAKIGRDDDEAAPKLKYKPKPKPRTERDDDRDERHDEGEVR
jgi:DUF4097 and DUF4098 domain-containing protein YvlB